MLVNLNGRFKILRHSCSQFKQNGERSGPHNLFSLCVGLHSVASILSLDYHVESLFFLFFGVIAHNIQDGIPGVSLFVRLWVSLQNNVYYIFQLDESVLVCWRLCISEHKFGEVQYTVSHLEISIQQKADSLGLFFEITLSNFLSIVRELNLDPVHDKLHRLYLRVATFDHFDFVQIVVSANHSIGPIHQTGVLEIIRFLIQIL